VKANKNYGKLGAGYLFPEIAKRTRVFEAAHSDVKVMRLGIGDTTQPLTPTVLKSIHGAAIDLGVRKTYTGYGDSAGIEELRELIASTFYNSFRIYGEDIFVSDGAKPDSANIQSIFSPDSVIAVQDPAYPVYVDSNVIAGRTGAFNQATGQYEGIVYMPCVEWNQFFPDVPKQKVDLIYLCSPNNPTGAVATSEQLKRFVAYAMKHKAIIIYDAAYSAFIQEKSLPRSIYDIDGADECAIEIGSFSKSHGFTGVRLGWTAIPLDLKVEDGDDIKVRDLWTRRQDTFFNGASNIVQQAGIAALSDEGMQESRELVGYYMENATIIKVGLERKGLTVFGGVNAPYVWMKTPNDMPSWDFFDKLLNETHVVGTPGAGFGPSGEGFFRLSAFGHREDIKRAVQSIEDKLDI